MINYELLLKDFGKIETCKNLDSEELKTLDYDFYKGNVVWEIQTEITFNNKNLDKMTNLIHVINLIEHGNLPSKDIIKLIEYYNGI